MPIHDWSSVSSGIFQDFHTSWITHLKESLNEDILPDGFYALSEQRSGQICPDVLTLQTAHSSRDLSENGSGGSGSRSAVATAVSPPQVSMRVLPAEKAYTLMRRSLVIRHSSDDRIVGLIEIVSKAITIRVGCMERFGRSLTKRLPIAVRLTNHCPWLPMSPNRFRSARLNRSASRSQCAICRSF